MSPSSSRKVLTVALAIALVAGLTVSSARAAEEAPQVSATITGPFDGCLERIDGGTNSIDVAGTAPDGSTVVAALFKQFDANGTDLNLDRDFKSSLAVNGTTISGTILAPASNSATKTVRLFIQVRDSDGSSAIAESNALTVDRERPRIDSARVISPTVIIVRFSENVTVPNGDNVLDWHVRGNRTANPSRIEGAGSTRTLTFDRLQFAADETPLFDYFPPPSRPTYYQDCMDSQIDGSSFTQTAQDGIPPAVPVIEAINSSPLVNDRMVGNIPAPRVQIGSASQGHDIELWLETNGQTGFQATDIGGVNRDERVGTQEVGTGSVTITSRALGSSSTPDTDFTFYARAIDPGNNASPSVDSAVYRLDQHAPVFAFAKTDSQTVTVELSEPLKSGQDAAGDWKIIGSSGQPTSPTSVTGSDAVRVLHISSVPNGATIIYERPASGGYLDEAENELASFTRQVTLGGIAKTLTLEPATDTAAAGSTQTMTMKVVDDLGGGVAGIPVALRATSGPSSSREPNGQIGACDTQPGGECLLSYTSRDLGRDVLQATGGGFQDTAEIEWTLEGTVVRIDANPETSSGPINRPGVTDLQIAAVEDGTPLGNVNLDGRLLGGPDDGKHIGECFTDSDGRCSIAYDSAVTRTDQLQFWVDRANDNVPTNELYMGDDIRSGRNEGADDDTNTLLNDPSQDVTSRSWNGVSNPQLQVDPETFTGAVGDRKSLLFVIRDQNSRAIPGLNVDARVISGPHAGTYIGECETGNAGTCTIPGFTSSKAGTDFIQGWIDLEDDDIASEATQFEARDESASVNEADQDVVQAVWGGSGSGGGTSPDPTNSPTGNATTTSSPSPTESGTVTTRKASVTASKTLVRYRRQVTLSGSIEDSATCPSATVNIVRRQGGTTFMAFKSVTAVAGEWTLSFRPSKSSGYRASVAGDATCDAAVSNEVAVKVRARITIDVVKRRFSGTPCAIILGRVLPSKKHRQASLQRQRGRGWKTVGHTTINDRSTYRFLQCPEPGTYRFRVRWSGDEMNEAATSRVVRSRIS